MRKPQKSGILKMLNDEKKDMLEKEVTLCSVDKVAQIVKEYQMLYLLPLPPGVDIFPKSFVASKSFRR